MRYLFLLLLADLALRAGAADTLRYRPFTISVFSNATAMPGSTIVKTGAIHPGICLGTEFFLNESTRNQWYESVKLGYFYHQYAQQAFQLYTENGLRHRFAFGLNAGLAAGFGVLLSKTDMQVFRYSDDGTYERVNHHMRLQVMPSVTAQLGWDIALKNHAPLTIFVAYQAWFQMPYVKQYVPTLPNVATHVGVSIPLSRK